MGDLDAKQARNEALRAELSALRIETENTNAQSHDAAHGQKLDSEAAQLESQVEAARAQRDMAVKISGDGSVGDATAAMRAAAGTEPEQVTSVESAPTEAPAIQPTLLVMNPEAQAAAKKDEEK